MSDESSCKGTLVRRARASVKKVKKGEKRRNYLRHTVPRGCGRRQGWEQSKERKGALPTSRESCAALGRRRYHRRSVFSCNRLFQFQVISPNLVVLIRDTYLSGGYSHTTSYYNKKHFIETQSISFRGPFRRDSAAIPLQDIHHLRLALRALREDNRKDTIGHRSLDTLLCVDP